MEGEKGIILNEILTIVPFSQQPRSLYIEEW